jgi:dolichol-phosphate mannosyltransferase
MDRAGSHDPAALPCLLEADLVVASRYVPGGEVRDWRLERRLISRGGCFYARTVRLFRLEGPLELDGS